MIADLGNFSLSLALLSALGAALACLAGAKFDSARALSVARWLLGGVAVMLTLASVVLAVALVRSDFRLLYVASYTELALPQGYKLAAFWAGQSGSLLTWAVMLAWMSAAFAAFRRRETGAEAATTLGVLAIVNAFFVALMLFADRPATATAPDTHANPFRVVEVVPADGHGLNPLLQDPAMIAHPPVLFLGYAGFTIPFAMLVGALVVGRRDNKWLGGTRRWLLASWLFLTGGIILGAEWAYVELGWGGYWGWDPVENASLLPWLTGTALLHSVMAQQHRGMFKIWNASLFALTFLLCIFSTYLTRSGVIQSVHGFGESLIGDFFLGFLIVTSLFTVGLLIVRRKALASEQELDGLIGREGAFLATNVLLVGMMLITLVGTIFPIISRVMSDREVAVGPPFYNKVVAPMGLLLAALMTLGPALTYGKGAAGVLIRKSIVPAALAALVVGYAWHLGLRGGWGLGCVAVTAFGLAMVVTDYLATLWTHVRGGENVLAAAVRIIDANHRRYGGQITHVGVLMIIVGIVGSSVFGTKQSLELSPGQSVPFANYTMRFEGLREVAKGNYDAVQAELVLTTADGKVSRLTPERRFYHKSEQPISEVALDSTWKRDVYVTLAGWEKGGQVTALEALVNPLVNWIWIGGWTMSAGALLSMLPRLLPQAARAASTEREQEELPVRAAPVRLNATA